MRLVVKDMIVNAFIGDCVGNSPLENFKFTELHVVRHTSGLRAERERRINVRKMPCHQHIHSLTGSSFFIYSTVAIYYWSLSKCNSMMVTKEMVFNGTTPLKNHKSMTVIYFFWL